VPVAVAGSVAVTVPVAVADPVAVAGSVAVADPVAGALGLGRAFEAELAGADGGCELRHNTTVVASARIRPAKAIHKRRRARERVASPGRDRRRSSARTSSIVGRR